MHCHRWNFLRVTMGLYKYSIPGASRNKQQDHPEPPVEFSAAMMGLYKCFCSILGGAVGPCKDMGGILEKTEGPFMTIGTVFLAAVQISSVDPYDPIGRF